MGNPAKKTTIECSGEDGLLQGLPPNLQLDSQLYFHKIGVCAGVNENAD